MIVQFKLVNYHGFRVPRLKFRRVCGQLTRAHQKYLDLTVHNLPKLPASPLSMSYQYVNLLLKSFQHPHKLQKNRHH